MGDAEVFIWMELRRGALGWQFRRQHPIGDYIVDFACIALKLIVELDGSQHFGSVEADAIRDAYLRAHGWTVIRFTSWDAVGDTSYCVETIRAAIAALRSDEK
jgi:very-short-patch-repair endonuclease